MEDVKDVLGWAQNGGLAGVLKESENGNKVRVDEGRVMVMGTSSGGHLALSTVRDFFFFFWLAYSVDNYAWDMCEETTSCSHPQGTFKGKYRAQDWRREKKAWTSPTPPLAILDFYGAKSFSSPFWTQPIPSMPAAFHAPLPPSDVAAVHAEKTVFIGGTSLEGQPANPTHPNPQQRQAFAMHAIATGKVLNSIWPRYPADLHLIDPVMKVSSSWPPTAIVHGTADQTIPIAMSKDLEKRLKEAGVKTSLFEVQGEPHTFVGKMTKGSATWDSQRRGFDWLEERLEQSYAVKWREKASLN
jgi:acetyl esterase/lipase